MMLVDDRYRVMWSAVSCWVTVDDLRDGIRYRYSRKDLYDGKPPVHLIDVIRRGTST